MEMKDRKLATEIAEERMSIIAPLLSQHMDSSQVAQLRREICERSRSYWKKPSSYAGSCPAGVFQP